MRFGTTATVCAAAIVLALSGCSSATGGQDPKSVQEQAAKLASESAAAIAPAPAQSVKRTEWEKCSEETPGVHRADYSYVLHIGVDQSASQPVFDQVTAYWKKQGYVTQPQGPGNTTRVVHLKNDADWSIGLGIDTDGQVFLSVDSGCAHVSADPKFG